MIEFLKHYEYYIAMAAFHLFIMVSRKTIVKAAKGSNSVWQWEELLQAVCLYFLCVYSIRIIFLDLAADPYIFGAFLGGAGIGGYYSLENKKLNKQ